ncbi:CorA metal ion transporter [Entophlyctis luteolus]|nr:CorA metal ion transporter [Entophlyctis luteolus]
MRLLDPDPDPVPVPVPVPAPHPDIDIDIDNDSLSLSLSRHHLELQSQPQPQPLPLPLPQHQVQHQIQQQQQYQQHHHKALNPDFAAAEAFARGREQLQSYSFSSNPSGNAPSSVGSQQQQQQQQQQPTQQQQQQQQQPIQHVQLLQLQQQQRGSPSSSTSSLSYSPQHHQQQQQHHHKHSSSVLSASYTAPSFPMRAPVLIGNQRNSVSGPTATTTTTTSADSISSPPSSSSADVSPRRRRTRPSRRTSSAVLTTSPTSSSAVLTPTPSSFVASTLPSNTAFTLQAQLLRAAAAAAAAKDDFVISDSTPSSSTQRQMMLPQRRWSSSKTGVANASDSVAANASNAFSVEHRRSVDRLYQQETDIIKKKESLESIAFSQNRTIVAGDGRSDADVDNNSSVGLPHAVVQNAENVADTFGTENEIVGGEIGDANYNDVLNFDSHQKLGKFIQTDGANYAGTGEDDGETDAEPNFPTYPHHSELDYGAIAEYLSVHNSTSTTAAELYDSWTKTKAAGEAAALKRRASNRVSVSSGGGGGGFGSKRRDSRYQHGEHYYQQLNARFTFHSDFTGTLRSPMFETLPFSAFDLPVADVLRSDPFWLDVCSPTAEEIGVLTRLFKIHPLTAEDIQTEEMREKCEAFPNYYFIAIRTFDSDQYSTSYMEPINVTTQMKFHSRPVTHLDNVLRRIEQLKVYGLTISPDWLNYALIDDITDGFMPPLRYIELEVDAIDELVLILNEREQSDMLRRIGHARKRVMVLLRLLITKADVIKAVIKRSAQRLSAESDTTLYLGDIQDHIITMVQNLNHCEKTLTRSHSNYLAQISIEITQASNRTNDVVMRMTALASILVPLNVITGLWGMNVQVPGEEDEGLMWFTGIVVVMALVALSSFLVIRRFNVV